MPSFARIESSTLQQQLDEITANTRSLVPPERLARIEQVIADLQASGIEARCLRPGASAPGFRLLAATGRPVATSDLLALGPVIVKFFRGRWDPYDMTELEAWESLQPTLRQRKALFVAISPQTPRQNAFTADRHHLSFPLLSDPASALAERFGIAYTVPAPTQTYYRSILINVPFLNGDNTWRLPLPATVILNPAGEVLYSEGYADHRRRPDPLQVLHNLQASA